MPAHYDLFLTLLEPGTNWNFKKLTYGFSPQKKDSTLRPTASGGIQNTVFLLPRKGGILARTPGSEARMPLLGDPWA